MSSSPVSQICQGCNTKIELAHLMRVGEDSWHRKCFRCGGKTNTGCSRILDANTHKKLDNIPYCESCHRSLKSTPAYAPKPPTDNINICFVGGVSTGKSTVLNAIFCEQLTQCKIKRTTMVPTVYIENPDDSPDLTPAEDIFALIAKKNADIIEKTERGCQLTEQEYSELAFNVGKLDINILPDAFVNVYDIPGLNDARTKDVYYNYLDTHFVNFNLMIFIVDIHSGLNTSDEMEIVQFIASRTRDQLERNAKKIYTLVIVNKADDMQLEPSEDGSNPDKLVIVGELEEMYKQVENTIVGEFQRHNISDHLIGIMPLCALDAYLYRRVKKHGRDFTLTREQILKIGINESGKKFSKLSAQEQEKRVYEILEDAEFVNTMITLSGFSCLERMLDHFLNVGGEGKTIRINNLLFELSKLPDLADALATANNMTYLSAELVGKHCAIYSQIKKIDAERYGLEMISFVDGIREVLESRITKYSDPSLLLADYDTFISQIMVPYLAEFYDTVHYPEILTTHVFKLVMGEITNVYTYGIGQFIVAISALKHVSIFTVENMKTLVLAIIQRTKTYKYPFEIGCNPNLSVLIECVREIQTLGVDIVPFLRFLLINKYKCGSYDIDTLYSLKMMYASQAEVQICIYIDTLISKCRNEDPSDLVFIDFECCESGGKPKYATLPSESIQLELYYLETIV